MARVLVEKRYASEPRQPSFYDSNSTIRHLSSEGSNIISRGFHDSLAKGHVDSDNAWDNLNLNYLNY